MYSIHNLANEFQKSVYEKGEFIKVKLEGLVIAIMNNENKKYQKLWIDLKLHDAENKNSSSIDNIILKEEANKNFWWSSSQT